MFFNNFMLNLCNYFFFFKDLDSIMEKEEITREKELENVCKEQAARIDELNQLV
jgi:hypothetical protein